MVAGRAKFAVKKLIRKNFPMERENRDMLYLRQWMTKARPYSLVLETTFMLAVPPEGLTRCDPDAATKG